MEEGTQARIRDNELFRRKCLHRRMETQQTIRSGNPMEGTGLQISKTGKTQIYKGNPKHKSYCILAGKSSVNFKKPLRVFLLKFKPSLKKQTKVSFSGISLLNVLFVFYLFSSPLLADCVTGNCSDGIGTRTYGSNEKYVGRKRET